MKKEVVFDDALKGSYADFASGSAGEATVDYKQVATLGVESFVAAIFGILGFFWKPFIIASILGIALGVLAKRKIARAPDEISGGWITTIGLVASSVLFVATIGWQIYAYTYSAPPGYVVLPFDDMGLDKDGNVQDAIVALDGHKVFIEGYMYPTKQHAGIENFTLVRTLGHCQYCSPGTNPADMIGVTMERGQSVEYRANKTVSVGGVLSVDPDFKRNGSIPYTLKANVFRK